MSSILENTLLEFLNSLNKNLIKNMNTFEIGVLEYKTDIQHHNSELVKALKNTKNSLSRYFKSIDNFLITLNETTDGGQYKFLNTIETEEDYNDIQNNYKSYLNNLSHFYNPDFNTNKKKYKILNNICGVSLQNNNIKLPVVNKMSDIAPMFYWYEGGEEYKKGIYCCICEGFYIKVPFPNVLMPADKDNRLHSLRCKYEDKHICEVNKKKISQIHNSEIRECFYVHKKEKFNKVGNQFRCYIEGFGNHNNLDSDMNLLTNFDIKHLLMYSISDDLLALIWYQNKFKFGNLVLSNLDTF